MKRHYPVRTYFGLLHSSVQKIVSTLEDWFHYAVWVFILFLMVLVTTGVISRYVWNRPILGKVDISELIIGVIALTQEEIRV